jgi:hypothetical protein
MQEIYNPNKIQGYTYGCIITIEICFLNSIMIFFSISKEQQIIEF